MMQPSSSSHSSKKRKHEDKKEKKNKKHGVSSDAASPLTSSGSHGDAQPLKPNAGIFSSALGELDLPSSDEVDSSDEEQSQPPAKSRGAISGSSLMNTSSLSTAASVSTPTSASASSAAADAVAAVLASSSGNFLPYHDQPSLSTVSDDVLQMQRQLKQQIPSFDPTMTAEQLLDSIVTPLHQVQTMHMMISDSLTGIATTSNDGNSHVDSSILATVKPVSGTIPGTGASSSNSASKKASKGDGRKSKASTNDGGVGSSSGRRATQTLEERFAQDMTGGSDNPLHTKWLMATALKEKGITYRTGTFSASEDQLIRDTIEGYVKRHNMAPDAVQRWFENSAGAGSAKPDKNEFKTLWSEIAVRLETRPLLNIYLHVRRMFHPQNNVGAWSKPDDDKLIMLYTKHKGQWTTIGNELGRMADSCRDRYRNHLKDKDTMASGLWKPEEDEKLLTIMQELALKQGKSSILDSTPYWTTISERMDGTRTRHQCRHRYSQTLQPRLERGEWTGPSSAAAAVAAAVAASASNAAAAAQQQQNRQQRQQLQQQQQQQQQHQQQQGLTDIESAASSPSIIHSSHQQDALILAAAMSGVLPSGGENELHWSHVDNTTATPSQPSEAYMAAAAAAAAASMKPAVPQAIKGPSRRRGGLQQQADVLNAILNLKCQDHTEIPWSQIATDLRDQVQASNEANLLKITNELHFQHGEGVDSAAATAAAVAAAQAQAVAKLQKVPASNQIARTFMASRCKIDGYKSKSLPEVVKLMLADVERRLQHRKNNPGALVDDDSLGMSPAGDHTPQFSFDGSDDLLNSSNVVMSASEVMARHEGQMGGNHDGSSTLASFDAQQLKRKQSKAAKKVIRALKSAETVDSSEDDDDEEN